MRFAGFSLPWVHPSPHELQSFQYDGCIITAGTMWTMMMTRALYC